MSERVHLSQFYVSSKVSVGSELFYICELGKYLSNFGRCVSLEGIILDTVLANSRFWEYLRVAVANGWVVDAGVDESELAITVQKQLNFKGLKNIEIVEFEVPFDAEDHAKRQGSYEYNCVTPKRVQTYFTSKTDDLWFWSLKGSSPAEEQINLRSLNADLASQSWVSLVAYVAVNRFVTGFPKKFAMEFSYAIVENKQLSIVDIMLLSQHTDALNGWFAMRLDVSSRAELHCGYEAWWYKGYEEGLLGKGRNLEDGYSSDEKIAYFRKLGLRQGDIVGFYRRDVSQQANYVKSVAGFNMAIIEKVDKQGVDLRIIHTKKTKHGWDKWFADKTMSVKALYAGGDNYKQFRSKTIRYYWRDLGVEYTMCNEEYFIAPLQGDDANVLDVSDGTRENRLLLPEADAVYWILKDYNVEFNEEHFLAQYFKNETPLYTRYMAGEDLSAYEAVLAD